MTDIHRLTPRSCTLASLPRQKFMYWQKSLLPGISNSRYLDIVWVCLSNRLVLPDFDRGSEEILLRRSWTVWSLVTANNPTIIATVLDFSPISPLLGSHITAYPTKYGTLGLNCPHGYHDIVILFWSENPLVCLSVCPPTHNSCSPATNIAKLQICQTAKSSHPLKNLEGSIFG